MVLLYAPLETWSIAYLDYRLSKITLALGFYLIVQSSTPSA